MSEQSGPRGPGQDERLEKEVRGQVQAGGRSTRAEEWREPEPAGEDQPTGDRGILPPDRRPAPAGMDPEDVEDRSDLARFLGPSAFPGDRDALLSVAESNQAPDVVRSMIAALPSGRVFGNLQEAASAIGIGSEER